MGGGEKMEERIVRDWNEATEIIRQETHPFGLMVICADVSQKCKFTYSTLEKTRAMPCVTSSICSKTQLRKLLKQSGAVCVGLPPADSGDHAKRHSIATMLRNAGAEKVYGVYLTVSQARFPEMRAVMDSLWTDPPTADGLDGLAIIEAS